MPESYESPDRAPEGPIGYRYRAGVLTVTTVNVNGLRAAVRKGFVPWLAGTAADVLCLQEVRAEPGQLPEEIRAPAGWHTV
jgi:exodeoxyribonuclease-3